MHTSKFHTMRNLDMKVLSMFSFVNMPKASKSQALHHTIVKGGGCGCNMQVTKGSYK